MITLPSPHLIPRPLYCTSTGSSDQFLFFLMVWSNHSTSSAESCACYSFVFCRFGAIGRPCQWIPAIAISLYFAGLEQLFNPVTAVQ
jgi:hypothetical protein